MTNHRLQRPILALLAFALGSALTACTVEEGGEGGTAAAQGAGGEVEAPIATGAAFTGLPSEPRGSASSDFWDHWGDGRAEMDSYRATVPRYGEPRDAELVLIYVTEPHDRRRWVKDDGAEAPHRVEVLKLNASLKFLTGIYPYSIMSSVFSPVDDWGVERFQPAKIGHSVQEWCGHYVHQVWPGREAQRSLRLSYFASEGESLTRAPVPAGTLYEDGLLIQLRELDGPFAGGGDWEGWIVPSLWNVRRGVGEAEPVRATIRRDAVEGARSPEASGSADGTGAAPPDGRDLTRFTLAYGEYERIYDVEAEPPRRILGWRTSLGDTVRLARTRRLPYWTQNDPEGRSFRDELGLSPDASGIPPRAAGSGSGAGASSEGRGALTPGSGVGGGSPIGTPVAPAC